MHRPINTHPQDNDVVIRDNDTLETLGTNTDDAPDSPSSAADAGLIDANADDDLLLDSEFDAAEVPREIPMSDLPLENAGLHMPVMSDMDAPGEIDMEELGQGAARDALPADARLDPLEP